MPVCKGCGGSFDDGFKFCPYCGRAKPESEAIMIEINVSSDDKWEICQTRQYTYISDNERNGEVHAGYFWADGVGRNGVFNAGESPIFQGSNGSKLTHDFLVNRLIKNGWEPDGSFGEEWWQKQFRRRYGQEYPPSWTTWEICLESGMSNTGYFVIRGCPSRNEKKPLKRNKSREFKTSFFGWANENLEKRQILEEFLTELKSEGYKLVSSSENESLKKCYWEEWQDLWYFQILTKEE